MGQDDRNKIAFIALAGSCLVGAFLISRLERRVNRLEEMVEALGDFCEIQFQMDVDDKFEDIVDRLEDD